MRKMLIHVWILTEIQYIAYTLDKSVALGENVFLELMNESVVIENLWTGKNQILVNKQKLIKTTSTVMKRTNIYLTCSFFFGESMPVSVTQMFGSLISYLWKWDQKSEAGKVPYWYRTVSSCTESYCCRKDS